jgi:hypothetical protein
MAFPAAVRAFIALAFSALSCGGAIAVPMDTLSANDPNFLAQDHWPSAQWVEPSTFVIAGMGGLDEQTSLEDSFPATQLEPSARAARLLALWIRRAAAADRAREDSLLAVGVAAPSLAEDASRPLVQLATTRYSHLRTIFPGAAGPTAWDIGSVSLAVAPLPGRASFDAYVAAPHAATQSNPLLVDAPPVRTFQVMPWLGLALALLGIGWIGWRTAD